MNITNTTQALQGVPNKAGSTEWLAPNETRDIDVTDVWFEKYSKRAMFKIEGVELTRSKTLGELNESLGDTTRQNLQIMELEEKLNEANDNQTRLNNELSTSAGRVSELETQVTDLKAEVDSLTQERDDLKRALDAIQNSGGDNDKPDPKFDGLEAKHKGAGSYSIFNAAGDELVAKMTQDQANEFNDKSVEDKVAYVKAAIDG